MKIAPDVNLSPEQQWLARLARPDTHIRVRLDGFPGFYPTDERWNIRFAGLGVHLLHFIVEGRIQCRVRDERFSLTGPGFVCLAPGVPLHYTGASRVLTMYRFRLEITRRGKRLDCPREYLRREPAPGLHTYMERLVETAEHPERLADWRARGLVLALFAEALSDDAAPRPGEGQALDRHRLREVTTHFHRHHRDWPAPADLARQVHLSPDYFTRLFRAATGLSPRTWMTRERIRLAALQLVESNRNVSEVAEDFGYQNVFFFSQQFKAVMRLSPTTYQRQRRAE
ncbi:MAG: AraC family transcriptional regulator [Verrucomicrobiota bacterium]